MPFQPGHPPYPRKRVTATPTSTSWDGGPISTDGLSAFQGVDEGFIAPPIRRWLMSDLDDWLLRRLAYNYMLGHEVRWWENKIASFASHNDFLFITNEQAVLLARREPHLITGTLAVREVFAWARSSEFVQGIAYRAHENTPAEAALLPLYRHLMIWATEAGARNITVGEASDLQPKRLERLYRSNGSYYLVRAPCGKMDA